MQYKIQLTQIYIFILNPVCNLDFFFVDLCIILSVSLIHFYDVDFMIILLIQWLG